MLERLTVSNFALIEYVEIEFSSGLNVFTGETGAGKSIVLDAVAAILGARSSSEYIRTTADAYCLQALFNIAELPKIQTWLVEHGIEIAEGELIVMRRLTRAGKNHITVNSIQVTLATLRELGGQLVDMHAQHQSNLLLQAHNHLSLLDTYADEELLSAQSAYKKSFEAHKLLEGELTEVLAQVRQKEQTMDILQWQIKEIEEVKPKQNEYEDLQVLGKRLSNTDKIRAAVENAHQLLEHEKNGLLVNMYKLEAELKTIAKYEDKFDGVLESIQEWQYLLTDAKADLLDYHERLAQGPQNLESTQKRLDVLYRLYKKYGEYEQTMQFLAKAKAEYEKLENMDEQVATLQNKVQQAMSVLLTAAQRLSGARKLVAESLSAQVQKHIRDLAMPEAIFEISVTDKAHCTADGRDEVVFIFSANVGQEARAVHKIASGGEISRIFLALKTVLMSRFDFATMIFDEVDTGVSGVTAQRMAEKLFLIARSVQTICVTHLPQVACMADRHICISKHSTDGQTITSVNVLGYAESVAELASIISGAAQTELTRDSAAQMLDLAILRKQELQQVLL